MKKRLSLFLALWFVLFSLLSCGESQEAREEETDKQPTAVTPADGSEEETDSETPNWDMVEKPALTGISVDIIQCPPSANYYDALDWEEITGDKLGDAIYNRNRFIEQSLDMTMNVVKENGAGSRLEQSAIAGSGDYDLGFDLIQSYGGGLLQKGLLRSYNTIKTIDLSNPWWYQSALRDMTIEGQSFFGLMDISFDMLESLTVLFYNGDLIVQNQLDDPYELFLENEWTVDRMLAMMETVTLDKNNDGTMGIKQDCFGLAGREYNFQPILFTSGVELISWHDDEKIFTLNMNDERFLNVAESVASIYYKGNPTVDYSDYDAGRQAFAEGRVLFYSRLLGDYNNMRTNEDDYGVICFPRYDYLSEETRYFVQNPDALFLPIVIGDDNGDGVQDFDEVGYFLEAIGAYSRDMTKDIYVESAVIGKGMRDQNSAAMVRIMMDNLGFDLGQSYGLSGILQGFGSAIIANGKFASTARALDRQFKKLTEKIEKSIEKAVEKQQEYLD